MSLEMMDEHERGERVRRWLHDNSGSLLGGIAVGLLCFFAWQWWQDSGLQAEQAAAADYQSLTDAIERKDAELVETLSQSLAEKHSTTAYSALAQMQLGAIRLSGGDADGALAVLKRAQSLAVSPALAALAQTRQARVLVAAGKFDEALALLNGVPAGFRGIADEIRGDALAAAGRREEAVKAYEDALTHLDANAATRGIVQLKLDSIGGPADTDGQS